MRLRYIEVFQALLQAETLTGAARLLNISQPAATKLLQQAERHLGFPLFVRVRGRIRLTPEAMILRQRVERISDELTELRRLAQNLRPAEHEMLRLVATPTLAAALLPRIVTRLRRAFRNVQLDLLTSHTREMVDSLLLRECDVGLTLQKVEHPGIRCEPLCAAPVVVIAKKGHWRAAEATAPLPLERLAGATLVGIAIRDGLGRMLHARLQTLAPAPRIATWVQTYQVARALVADDHGLALVDGFTAASGGGELQRRRLDPVLDVTLYALHRIDAPLTPLQAAVIKHAQDVAQATVGTDPATPAAASRATAAQRSRDENRGEENP